MCVCAHARAARVCNMGAPLLPGMLPHLPCMCCCSVWVWAPPGVFHAMGLFSLVLLPVLTTTQPSPKAPGSTQRCGHCLEHLWIGPISEAGRAGTAQLCARRGCLATGASAEGGGHQSSQNAV